MHLEETKKLDKLRKSRTCHIHLVTNGIKVNLGEVSFHIHTYWYMAVSNPQSSSLTVVPLGLEHPYTVLLHSFPHHTSVAFCSLPSAPPEPLTDSTCGQLSTALPCAKVLVIHFISSPAQCVPHAAPLPHFTDESSQVPGPKRHIKY